MELKLYDIKIEGVHFTLAVNKNKKLVTVLTSTIIGTFEKYYESKEDIIHIIKYLLDVKNGIIISMDPNDKMIWSEKNMSEFICKILEMIS